LSHGLSDAAVAGIQAVLAAHPEVERAVLYGSRALGRHRPGSDIDLTLFGPAVTRRTVEAVSEELDDLLLPQMIDLSRIEDIRHPALRDHIARVGRELYTRTCGRPVGGV
jgi:predicted nucleotidyltransferase